MVEPPEGEGSPGWVRHDQASRSWLEAVVQSLQEAVIGSTIDGVIVSWNAGAERIFGYTEEEALGCNATMLRLPGSVDEITGLRTRISRGEHLQNRLVWVRKDGTTVVLVANSSPIIDGSGSVIGTAMVARAVGEHERVDVNFRSLIEAAPDAMVCVDEHGVIALVNAQAEHLFDYPRDQMIGRRVEALVPEWDLDGHPEVAVGYFAHPEPRRRGVGQSLVGRRRDSSEFPAEISLSAIQTEEGVLVSATIRDETERRQAAIVASSPEAIIGRDLHGKVTSWNSGAERMYGYSAVEATGGDMVVALPCGGEGELLDLTARVERGELVEQYETRRIRKDGAIIDVSITMSPIRDAHGAVVGTATVSRNITESKRSLEALRVLQARHSAILEAALDCIITMDHQGRIVEFNPAAERTFGYARSEAVGQTMANLIIPPLLRQRHAFGLAHYLASGEGPILGQRLELTAQRADGSEFPIELAITKVDLPGDALFTGYLRDVTDQKRVQGELANSGRLLETMLNNSPALIALTDTDGRYLFVNRSFAEVAGVDRDAAIGRTTEEVWPIEPARASRANDLEVLRTGNALQYESISLRPDGERCHLVAKFPVFDAAGTAYATATIATDITEIKAAAAERELLGERQRQSERLESLGQLAGGIAHDFNNLLGVILNYAAFVAEATADNPTAYADVEQIRAAAESAARLTRQLLIVGRRETIRTETLDLNTIVADIRGLLARTIGAHIHLSVHPAPQLPTIQADRGQIEQVVLNLAVNARDAMPAGGTLTIATRVVDLDDGYRRLHPDAHLGHHVELSVSDTGVGIPPEIVAHIFEPFFTTKPKGSGTGLGLATVYGIVTEAEGSLSVYSEPGIGTTFRIAFLAVDAAVTTTPAAGTDDLEGHGQTILIVDDESALLEVTARTLRRHGYTVVETTTGSEAMAFARGHNLQLLLTDSIMPHMSGRELAQQIRDIQPDLPVLFMSGYTEGVIGPQRLILEGSELIEKPFTAQALLKGAHDALAHADPGRVA